MFWKSEVCLFLGIDRTAGAIRGRTERVIDVVTAEMEKYETGEYTETVLESVRVLHDQSKSIIFSFYQVEKLWNLVVPNFVEKIKTTIDFLQMKSGQDDRKVRKRFYLNFFLLKSSF